MSLVNISIVGNVIKPPQQHIFGSGKSKTTVVVAVDIPGKKSTDGRYESEIYRVEAWGKLGDVAHKYLEKGSLVGATGKLVLSRWQDRDGRDRCTPTVEADQIALPPKPKAGDSTSGYSRINPMEGAVQFDTPDDSGSTAAPSDMSAQTAPASSEAATAGTTSSACSTESGMATSAAMAASVFSSPKVMSPGDPTGGIKESNPPVPDAGTDGDGEGDTSPADPDDEWNEDEVDAFASAGIRPRG